MNQESSKNSRTIFHIQNSQVLELSPALTPKNFNFRTSSESKSWTEVPRLFGDQGWGGVSRCEKPQEPLARRLGSVQGLWWHWLHEVYTPENWRSTWSGWWELKHFYFHPDPWGDDPIWRSYFSIGLKPPTSDESCLWLLIVNSWGEDVDNFL